MIARILQGRVERFCAHYKGPPFMALLCDPPYELGFMGKDWDKSGVAFDPSTWAALRELLYPGAWGMAFASSRGWHRMAVAIEDGGFRIHPSIFCWANFQSFPKATRIDTQVDRRKGGPGITLKVVKYLRKARDAAGLSNRAIDEAFGFNGMAGHWCGFSQPEIPRLEHWPKLKKLLGLDDRFDEAIEAHEREVVGKHPAPASEIYRGGKLSQDVDITAPATPLARAWAGHRYGGQVLKNSIEPVIVFQRPYEGRPIDCITETGAGAIWVDGGRIGTDWSDRPDSWKKSGYSDVPGKTSMFGTGGTGIDTSKGRWPANLVLCHTSDCHQVGEALPEMWRNAAHI